LNYSRMKSIIEGLLFAAGEEGLTAKQLADVLETDVYAVQSAVADLKRELEEGGRGVRIAEVAGGYQMTTCADHAEYIRRLARSPQRAPLSQAALETLAIIAYRQPITRVEIEQIRGVSSERAIQTLLSRQLIEEVGRADAVGRPILYGTTKRFLEYFGLRDLSELPPPEEDLPDGEKPLFDVEQMTIDEWKPHEDSGNGEH